MATINGNNGNNILNGVFDPLPPFFPDRPDIINGLGGNDILNGLGTNDTLNGGLGNDTLNGNGGNDTLNGDAGNDTINGGTGNDTINGGTGNDTINGGTGNDTLIGGSGNDILVGGLGKDTMSDQDGNDIYRYFSTSESAVGAQRDVILDFSRGVDKLDLSSIDANLNIGGNQAFTFIGNNNFTGTKGEVRFYTSGSTLFVQAEINGDGNTIADMEIQLNGLASIAAADIIL